MTTIHLLALAGYFLCLYEYIAMRHRVICAESDMRIARMFKLELDIYSAILYWNRGTK